MDQREFESSSAEDERKQFGEVLVSAVESVDSSNGDAESPAQFEDSPRRKKRSPNRGTQSRSSRRKKKKAPKPKAKWYSSKINLLILVVLLSTVIGISIKVAGSFKKNKDKSNMNTSSNADLNTGSNNEQPMETNSSPEFSDMNTETDIGFDLTEEETFEVIPGVNSGGDLENVFATVVLDSPTKSPTDLPTNSPTDSPTSLTTINSDTDTDTDTDIVDTPNIRTPPPTKNPSFAPSPSPTPNPTPSPTALPTEGGTLAPTKCWSWRLKGQDINGRAAGEESGSSVSLAFNGKHVAIGGMNLVRTYMISKNDGWAMTQEARANFKNIQVALSGDGLRLIIGSPLTDRTTDPSGMDGNGEVRAFQYSTTIQWFVLGQTLYGNELDKMFGNAIDINYIGSKIIVGSAASVRVYELQQEMTPNGLSARWEVIRHIIKIIPDVIFGSVVAISPSGNRIAIGEPESDYDQRGMITVFDLEPYVMVLTLQGVRFEDKFGKSIAMSADGNRIVVGAHWGDYVQAYEYLADQDAWALMGYKIYGDEDSDSFGRQVDMSHDGRRIAIGAPADSTGGDLKGMVQVYEYIEGEWVQVGENIYGENEYDYAGWSLSLSGDGRSIAVGSDFNGDNGYKSGHVRVFDFFCDE